MMLKDRVTLKTGVMMLKMKNAGLFQPKVVSNMDKPKCWVKNVMLKVEVGLKL